MHRHYYSGWAHAMDTILQVQVPRREDGEGGREKKKKGLDLNHLDTETETERAF